MQTKGGDADVGISAYEGVGLEFHDPIDRHIEKGRMSEEYERTLLRARMVRRVRWGAPRRLGSTESLVFC